MLKNRNFFIILFIIFILAATLRFYNLTSRGLLDWDEAYYLEIVKTQRAVISWTFNCFFGSKSLGSFQNYILENGGAVNTFAKDGFLVFVLIASFFMGLKSYTSLIVSAIFGTLTVGIIYLLGRKLFDRRSGLIAMFLIAISSYHIHYSRSGFSQAVSVFFIYLGLLFFVLSIRQKENLSRSNKFLAFCGLSTGYAISCHYNLFLMFASIYIFELFWQYREKVPIKNRIKRIVLLGVFSLIPILFWSVLSEAIKAFIYSNPQWVEAVRGATGRGDFVSFFGRLKDLLNLFLSSPFRSATQTSEGRDLLFYFKRLWEWGGPAVLILLLTSIIFLSARLFAKFDYGEFIILFLAISSLIFWSSYGWQVTRSFLASIPAIALLIGRMLRGFKKSFIALVCLAVIISEGFFLYQEISYKSGYPEAIEYMKTHRGVKHLSSQYTISRFLVGRKNALDITVSFEGADIEKKLRRLYEEEGYRYLLLDQMQYISDSNLIVRLTKNTKPVFTTAHSTLANLYENDTRDFPDKVKNQPQILKVYQLEDIVYE